MNFAFKQYLINSVFGLGLFLLFICIFNSVNPEYVKYFISPKSSTEVEISSISSFKEEITSSDGNSYTNTLYSCTGIGVRDDNFKDLEFRFNLKDNPEKGYIYKINIYKSDNIWITNPFGVDNFKQTVIMILIFPFIGFYIFLSNLLKAMLNASTLRSLR